MATTRERRRFDECLVVRRHTAHLFDDGRFGRHTIQGFELLSEVIVGEVPFHERLAVYARLLMPL